MREFYGDEIKSMRPGYVYIVTELGAMHEYTIEEAKELLSVHDSEPKEPEYVDFPWESQ